LVGFHGVHNRILCSAPEVSAADNDADLNAFFGGFGDNARDVLHKVEVKAEMLFAR